MSKVKYNLFLDDVRMPHTTYNYTKNKIYIDFDWQVKRSYDEFVEMIIDNGLPEVVSFDHDLADAHYDPNTWTENFVYQEKTGMDCVKWLVNYCIDKGKPFPTWYIHSMNPIGSENMRSYITSYLKQLEHV